MFDVFRSRDKAVRAFLIFLLGLVALSMVTYLIPTSGNSTTAGDESVVAQIGKDKITAQEVTRTIQRMTQSRQLPSELLSIYVPQVIQQMINERAMAWKAADMGMKVSTEDADNAIIDSIPADYVKNGKVDSATLSALLQQEGTTLGDLRANTQKQILISRLEAIVAGGVVVSNQEVEKEFHRRNDKVKVEYVVVDPAKFQKEAEATDAETQAYYDTNKQSFQVPDKRSIAVITLDPAKVGAGIQVSEAQLHSDYNNRQAEFQTPERVQARHILLKSDASNDATVKAKAEALLKQIQGGADFAKLAKEKSEDTGSGANGGELGWIVKGQTVPEFEKASFGLKVGETSGLVKTTYGYHIIQVEAHEQPHLQPFDEVKGLLTADFQKRAASQMMQTLTDKVIADLRKDPTHPEKVAQDAGGTLKTADNVQPGDPIPGFGVNKELSEAISTLKKGEVTPGAIVQADGSALIAVVTGYEAAHIGSLEEVKAQAKSRATEAKLKKIVADKAAELASKTQSMGGDLAKAAKSMGLEVRTSNDVKRDDAIEGLGQASSNPDIFVKPVGTVLGPVTVSSGQAMIKIVSKTPADPAEMAAQSSKIIDELRQSKARDRAALFQHGLRDSLTASGKLKVNQDVIDRIVASYRARS
jgi:peptidyl-prolyl cis-trans isomerase D